MYIDKLRFTITIIVGIFSIISIVWAIINGYNSKIDKKFELKEDKTMVKQMLGDHEKLNNEQFKGVHEKLEEIGATTEYIRDKVDKIKT
jgi:methyl coenzyme M reductase gamma subunit